MYRLVLWCIRIGVFILVATIFLSTKKKSKKISKILDNKDNYYKSLQPRFVKYLDSLFDNGLFTLFRLKENSDKYNKTETLIAKTGNAYGLTVNIIQGLRVLIPILTFTFGVVFIGFLDAINKFALNNTLQNNATLNTAYSFIQPVANTQPVQGMSDLKKLLILFLISLCSYLIPDLFLKRMVKKRSSNIKTELSIMESFTIVMLDTGNFSVYQIIETVANANSIDILRPILFSCLNEYYINAEVAIQNMANKVKQDEFQIICNTLKDAVGKNKDYINKFMNDNIEQLKKYQRFEIQKRIKQKPMAFVLLLAIPLFNIVLIWIYPWISKVFNMLSGGYVPPS